MNANPTSASKLGEPYLGLKAPIVERSIPFSSLVGTSAAAVKGELEAFFTILAQENPAIIGGSLPPADFYL